MEKEVKKIIEEVTGCKFVGKIRVQDEKFDDGSTLWSLILNLDTESTPIVLAKEGNYENFLDFVRKEIKSRKLQGVSFWNTVKVYNE